MPIVEWLNYAEAVALLDKNGIKLSWGGLTYQGLKNRNFSRRAEDGVHWEYNNEELKKYIKQHNNLPIAGYITINEASEKFKLSKDTIYYNVKVGKFSYQIYGRGANKYVKSKEIQKYIRERGGALKR